MVGVLPPTIHSQLSFFWRIKGQTVTHSITELVCMQVCLCSCFLHYSDSGSHLWFEAWCGTKLSNRYCEISALVLLLVALSSLKMALQNVLRRSNNVPCMCDTVAGVSCGENVLTTTCLSVYHLITPRCIICLNIYKMNFWSHCDLVTMRGKTESVTCRGHFLWTS